MGADKQGRVERPGEPAGRPLGREGLVLLAVILAAAGALRMVRLADWPPGLHQDEASRAWNCRCLLATGKDHRGEAWPIFSNRVYGGDGFTLFNYVLMPFQWVGGMNVWTCRLPGALAGTLSVLLIYLVGSRMFCRAAGLVAAALLAVAPWAVQASRTGMGASVNSPVVLFMMLALIWAGAPFVDGPNRRRVRPLLAALAGGVAGISCYGYFAWRVFLPLFTLAVVIATWRGWWKLLRTRRGGLMVAAFVVAAAVTFGPLAWRHLAAGASPGVASGVWVWDEQDGFIARAGMVMLRYLSHFGLDVPFFVADKAARLSPGVDFLFLTGDKSEILSPPDSWQVGQLYWYMLPMLLAGAAAVLWRARSSVAARTLLAWVLIYPAADLFWKRPLEATKDMWAMHSLRSYPGIDALYLLAAVGVVAVGGWLYARRRKLAFGLAGLALAGVIGLNVSYYPTFFRDFGRRTVIYHDFHADIVEACEWLKPRLDRYDAVFWTVVSTNQPYMVTLIALDYDPDQWFREVRAYRDVHPGRDICVRYGKMHFLYDFDLEAKPILQAMQKNGKRDHILFIVRPGRMKKEEGKVHEIFRPDGESALVFYERDM